MRDRTKYFKESGKRYYKKNKELVRQRSDAAKVVNRARNQRLILEYLADKSCLDCGESDSIVLDFDHLRDKRRAIGRMVSLAYSWKTIMLEIDKCEIVCANCHRRRTGLRGGFYRSIANEALKAKPPICNRESPAQVQGVGSI